MWHFYHQLMTNCFRLQIFYDFNSLRNAIENCVETEKGLLFICSWFTCIPFAVLREKSGTYIYDASRTSAKSKYINVILKRVIENFREECFFRPTSLRISKKTFSGELFITRMMRTRQSFSNATRLFQCFICVSVNFFSLKVFFKVVSNILQLCFWMIAQLPRIITRIKNKKKAFDRGNNKIFWLLMIQHHYLNFHFLIFNDEYKIT